MNTLAGKSYAVSNCDVTIRCPSRWTLDQRIAVLLPLPERERMGYTKKTYSSCPWQIKTYGITPVIPRWMRPLGKAGAFQKVAAIPCSRSLHPALT
jgi:hypothetical protein